MLISMWMMGAMVVVYVYQSGVALRELASSSSREFLSPLGLHANELGRLYEVAYALLLFTWAESKRPGLRLVLLASMGWMIVAMVLTFSRGAFLGFIVVNALFLLALLDMGVVGLILVCAYFVHVWKGFRASSVDPALSPIMRGFYLGAAAGLASLLISYVTDSSLMPKPEQVFLWLAIGMMYGQLAKKAAT